MSTADVINTVKDTKKRNATITNYKRRLLAVGEEIPEPVKTVASGVGKGALKILDEMDRYRAAGTGALYQAGVNINPNKQNQKRSIAEAAYKGFTKQENITGQQILGDLGVKNKAAKFTGGMAIDTLTDPFTYTTFGMGSLAKGVARGVGGTITKETMETAGQRAASNIARASKDKLLKENKAATVEDLAKRLGTDKNGAYNVINKQAYGQYFDEAVKAMPTATSRQLRDVAARKYAEKAGQDYTKGAEKMAGKGVTIGGKTLVSGAEMQDIGAKINKAVMKTPVGKPIGAVAEKAGELFSNKAIAGLDGQMADIYRQIENNAAGTKALRSKLFSDKAMDIETLQDGLTFKGRPISDVIEDAIVKNREGLTKADLDTVITTAPEKKFVAKRLAASQSGSAGSIVDPENMTLGELINLYPRQYKKMLIEESRLGLQKLPPIQMYKNTDVAGRIANNTLQDEYMARVRNTKQGFTVRGGKTKNLSVSNAFAQARKGEYKGMTSKEINDQLEQQMRDAGFEVPKQRFLEEDPLRAMVSRQLSSDRMIADKQFVDEVLGTFGQPIRDFTPANLQRLKNEGYAIVTPKSSFNIFLPGDVKPSEVATEITGGAKRATLGTQETWQILDKLKSDEAINLFGQYGKGAQIYAVPIGVVDKVNAGAQSQMKRASASMDNLMSAFYKMWKPTVTGMRLAYHARNLASSTFNNFLALGKEMVSLPTQQMALAVAVAGRGMDDVTAKAFTPIVNHTIDIGGKQYTANDIYKMMIDNNALNTYILTDTNDLSRAIINDVVSKQEGLMGKSASVAGQAGNAFLAPIKAWARAGKGLGNITEEYVRAVNFIGHLRQGYSPAQAGELVNKYHFDYQDLTDFEKGIKNNVIPFYTWLRKNYPLQLEAFLNDPKAYQFAYRAQQRGAENEGIDYSQVPTYLQKNLAVPYGTNAEGRVRMVDLGLPLGDLQTTPKDLALGANPFIKAGYEVLSGQSMLTGAPVRQFEGEESVDLINYMKQNKWLPESFKGALTSQQAVDILLSKGGIKATATAKYIINNSGVFRDIVNGASTATQVVQQGRKYSTAKSPIAQAAERFVDPNFFKYYSPEAGQRSADYAYQRELANKLQEVEKLRGIQVPTINDLNK